MFSAPGAGRDGHPAGGAVIVVVVNPLVVTAPATTVPVMVVFWPRPGMSVIAPWVLTATVPVAEPVPFVICVSDTVPAPKVAERGNRHGLGSGLSNGNRGRYDHGATVSIGRTRKMP